ncbi:MAG: hypothetical protein LBF78_11040 [Treponema sp.]|nr:hypothetical protein [Treponema sp.]
MGPNGYLSGDTGQVVTEENIEAYFDVMAKLLRFAFEYGTNIHKEV